MSEPGKIRGGGEVLSAPSRTVSTESGTRWPTWTAPPSPPPSRSSTASTGGAQDERRSDGHGEGKGGSKGGEGGRDGDRTRSISKERQRGSEGIKTKIFHALGLNS